MNQDPVAVGPRIRALRAERQLSVRSFAGQAGLSPGLISQVERGLADPSLETLRRIAQALSVPIFSLFQQDGGTDPVRVVRANERINVRSPHGEIVYARVSAGSGQLEVLEGVLEPGGASSEQPWNHPSEECAVVLSGTLSVQVDGRQWELHENDSCTFDSRLPHLYRNPGTQPCRFLLSVNPPSY